MGRRGGAGRGQGRRLGVPNLLTQESMDAYRAIVADDIRRVPGRRSSQVVRAAYRFVKLRRDALRAALKADQFHAAHWHITALERRCFGREKEQLEIAGPGGGPIAVTVAPGYYRSEFPDGTETAASAARAREGLPKDAGPSRPRRRKAKPTT